MLLETGGPTMLSTVLLVFLYLIMIIGTAWAVILAIAYIAIWANKEDHKDIIDLNDRVAIIQIQLERIQTKIGSKDVESSWDGRS